MKRGMTVKENAENHYRRGLLNDKSNKGALQIEMLLLLISTWCMFISLGDKIYMYLSPTRSEKLNIIFLDDGMKAVISVFQFSMDNKGMPHTV